MKNLTEKQKKEFENFLNIQMMIFKEHCERIGQRIINKIGELKNETSKNNKN